MAGRVNYSGLIIAGLGFFLTRFTVTLALYENPVRFLLAGVVPLTLGLGLAAFGVALAVAEVNPSVVRTVAAWAIIGAGTMLVFALLTLFGSSAGQMPALETVRSRAYLSNFLIGGSVGGTLTGLYASRNRRHRAALRQQANRLEVLNRLLRHEVLNALTVIRGYAPMADEDGSAAGVIRQHADAIEETIDEVKHLAGSARQEAAPDASIDLTDQLQASIDTIAQRYPESDITLRSDADGLTVRADHRLDRLFTHWFEHCLAHAAAANPEIAVTVGATETTAAIDIDASGAVLTERERALLETGEIPEYDDPSSGFGLNIVRLLVERYQGSISAEIDAVTTVTIELPRAEPADTAQRPLPSEVAGIRPAIPHLLVTFGAAMIAGVFWGLGAELLGGSIAFIGVFYGTASPVVGWITHQFHSVVFAFAYAGLITVLPAGYRDHVPTYVGLGIGWGMVLWAGAAGVIAPIWLRLLGIQATIPNLSFNLFVAHLSWGISLGLLTVYGYRHVVPWLSRTDWISTE